MSGASSAKRQRRSEKQKKRLRGVELKLSVLAQQKLNAKRRSASEELKKKSSYKMQSNKAKKSGKRDKKPKVSTLTKKRDSFKKLSRLVPWKRSNVKTTKSRILS